jgi:hypothetical protein
MGRSGARPARVAAGVATIALAVALGACAGRHRATKNQSGVELCAADQRAFTERVARERDEAPHVPYATEVARWHRLESAHFLLSTDLQSPSDERTLRELEDYFAALTSIAFPVSAPATKISVIGLASPSETQRYLQPCFNGLYVPDLLYEPIVVLGTGPHGIEDAIARHELVHYAMRLAYRRSLPHWFAEGMAAYFETLAYDPGSGYLMFGRASLSRVYDLREKGPLLPVEKLVDGSFDPTLDRTPSAYYASSWLLTHALINDAPSVFDALDKALLAGADITDGWAKATTPAFRTGADAWLTRYYNERRYEAGRRTPWRAPVETFRRTPMNAADVLSTLAVLHVVGWQSQAARADWHKTRAAAAAHAALERDPTQLAALQVEWAVGSPPSADRVRPAMRGHEQSWGAWLFLSFALTRDRMNGQKVSSDEIRDSLARAATLDPAEPEILLAQGGEALEQKSWDEATKLFERGLPFAVDEPSFARGYVAAMAHDARCGAVARDLQNHTLSDDPAATWIAAARAITGCRTHGAPSAAHGKTGS